MVSQAKPRRNPHPKHCTAPFHAQASLNVNSGGGAVAVKNQTKCAEIRIKLADPSPSYDEVRSVSAAAPVSFAFTRDRADLGKQLHFIVEPFHSSTGSAQVVDVYVS